MCACSALHASRLPEQPAAVSADSRLRCAADKCCGEHAASVLGSQCLALLPALAHMHASRTAVSHASLLHADGNAFDLLRTADLWHDTPRDSPRATPPLSNFDSSSSSHKSLQSAISASVGRLASEGSQTGLLGQFRALLKQQVSRRKPASHSMLLPLQLCQLARRACRISKLVAQPNLVPAAARSSSDLDSHTQLSIAVRGAGEGAPGGESLPAALCTP